MAVKAFPERGIVPVPLAEEVTGARQEGDCCPGSGPVAVGWLLMCAGEPWDLSAGEDGPTAFVLCK